jgi:hypothetical protein
LVELLGTERSTIEVYRTGLFTQVKAYSSSIQQLLGGLGKNVLAGVLLHVVKAAGPIHLTGDDAVENPSTTDILSALRVGQRFFQDVNHRLVCLAFHHV